MTKVASTQTLELAKEARERIRNGIAWLEKNAPEGWEMRLLSFTDHGQASLIAKDSYSDECALALAFGNQKDMTDKEYRRVTHAKVAKKLNMSGIDSVNLGFSNESIAPGHRFDNIWEHEFFKYLSKRYAGQQEHS